MWEWSGWERKNQNSIVFVSRERSQTEEEEGRPPAPARGFRGFGGGEADGGVNGKERRRDGGAGVRTARQYLQESELALAEGQTETQSLSPHLRCRPTPNDAPTGEKPTGFSRRASTVHVTAHALPQLLQYGRWRSLAFRGGNIWGLLPRSKLWKQWPPASSYSGCCRFSAPPDSAPRQKNNKVLSSGGWWNLKLHPTSVLTLMASGSVDCKREGKLPASPPGG